MMHKRLNVLLRSCKFQVFTGMSIALQWQQLQQPRVMLLLLPQQAKLYSASHSKKHSIHYDSCVKADTVPHTAWIIWT